MRIIITCYQFSKCKIFVNCYVCNIIRQITETLQLGTCGILLKGRPHGAIVFILPLGGEGGRGDILKTCSIRIGSYYLEQRQDNATLFSTHIIAIEYLTFNQRCPLNAFLNGKNLTKFHLRKHFGTVLPSRHLLYQRKHHI